MAESRRQFCAETFFEVGRKVFDPNLKQHSRSKWCIFSRCMSSQFAGGGSRGFADFKPEDFSSYNLKFVRWATGARGVLMQILYNWAAESYFEHLYS